MSEEMTLNLKVWRQKSPEETGALKDHVAKNVSPDMSFLEMLDELNNELVKEGEEPIHFEHDCREGICGTCSLVVNGVPHGPDSGTTVCQLHMRSFKDGDTIYVEPWRAKAFPVIKDLVVDRSAFDRIISSGGFVSANVGGAPDGNAIPIPKASADQAMDAAACIGCGACVAACPNSSAMLFVGAKVSQMALLPQGKPESSQRVLNMVSQMDAEGFGNCSNHYECEAACPKEISVAHIARMNRQHLSASLTSSLQAAKPIEKS